MSWLRRVPLVRRGLGFLLIACSFDLLVFWECESIDFACVYGIRGGWHFLVLVQGWWRVSSFFEFAFEVVCFHSFAYAFNAFFFGLPV